MVAAMNGHVRAVGLLIAAKARVNIQQKVRFTVCLLVLNKSNSVSFYKLNL